MHHKGCTARVVQNLVWGPREEDEEKEEDKETRQARKTQNAESEEREDDEDNAENKDNAENEENKDTEERSRDLPDVIPGGFVLGKSYNSGKVSWYLALGPERQRSPKSIKTSGKRQKTSKRTEDDRKASITELPGVIDRPLIYIYIYI